MDPILILGIVVLLPLVIGGGNKIQAIKLLRETM